MAIADPAYAHLPEGLASGAVAVATIDARVRRVLEAKIHMSLLDDPYVDEDRARAVLADPPHREAARVAAEGGDRPHLRRDDVLDDRRHQRITRDAPRFPRGSGIGLLGGRGARQDPAAAMSTLGVAVVGPVWCWLVG